MKQHHTTPLRVRRMLSVLFVTAIGYTASAQTQFTGWVGTFQNYKLTNKTGLYFDGQLRSTGQLQQVHSLLLRPGMNIYFNPSLTGTVGYAYIHQQRTAGSVTGYIPEHRIWEQLLYTHTIKWGHTSASGPAHTYRSGDPVARSAGHHHGVHAATLTHRLRLEQRFLPKFHAEGGNLAHTGHAHSGRLRYFTRAVIPLGGSRHSDNNIVYTPQSARQDMAGNPVSTASGQGQSHPAPPPFTRGFFAAVQNEIFANISGVSAVNGKFFDQNRAYLAVGYRYSRQFDVELGYMNQYISGTGSNSTNNHILQMATYLRL
jgi:hypothetical protein